MGIKLSKGGVNSFNFVISGPMSIDKANTGIGRPPESGCCIFDGVIDGIAASRCSNWGTNIDYDRSTGGGTNMNIRNLWAPQASGSEQPESEGHRIRAMVGLRASNMIGDHLQKEWLYLKSCSGETGHLHFKSCDASASTGQLNLATNVQPARKLRLYRRRWAFARTLRRGGERCASNDLARATDPLDRQRLKKRRSLPLANSLRHTFGMDPL